MKKGDIVMLTKLSDDKFGGIHPNFIDAGYVQIGKLVDDVEVGKRCNVVNERRLHDWLSTSKVTEIIDEQIFKTENSTYKIVPYIYLEHEKS